VQTISHRELRNNSGRVLEAVRQGAVFAVTNRGEITALLVPPDTSANGVLAASGRVRRATSDAPLGPASRIRSDSSTASVLDVLRDER
jgi:prevent-host-death family protein